VAVVDRKSLSFEDTVFALASGPLPSAVSIYRVSGRDALAWAGKYFRSASGTPVQARGMLYGALFDAKGQEVDQVLLLCFLGPHSFTGENVIEIQCHGSLAVAEKLERLFLDEGLRPALRGEFSYRAFHYGRMSAREMDRLGDVFAARSGHDLERIYQRRDTALEAEVGKVREELIRLQAILDTAVDFSEEYSSVVESAKGPLVRARDLCRAVASRYEVFKQGGQTPRLVLAGAPNAGKSSLFNALLCRYRAIVNAEPGTTRDAIEEDVDLAGRRWKLVDTAGFRKAGSETEKQGIDLGADFLESASFWILVVDGCVGLTEAETGLLKTFGDIPHLAVWNKKDLPGFRPSERADFETSALDSESVQALSLVLSERALPPPESTRSLPTSFQAKRLLVAAKGLDGLLAELSNGVVPEVLGEANRMVLRQVESVVGDVGVEEVLDRVFAEFCIGK
jgi:tRNA modification GTPase